MNNRRQAIAGMFAATTTAAMAAVPAPAGGSKKPAPPPAQPKDQKTMNAYAITRHRFGLQEDWTVPRIKSVEQMPLSRVFFQDNEDFTLLANGAVQCNAPGLYRVLLGVDWKAQAGLDIDRRMVGVRRKLAGDTSDFNLKDIRLGSIDTPACDSPVIGRYSGAIDQVDLMAGQKITLDVQVRNSAGAAAGITLGDVAQVGHTTLPDTVNLWARVIGPDIVRVSMLNLGGTMVKVDTGNLNVMAMSTRLTRGESNDAWNVLNCPLEELQAGDVLYACARVLVPGDYVQATERTTFMQIERFG